MLVTLIPLLLAANINVNDGDWKYGPEVIYDAKFDGISPQIEETGKYVMFNTTMKLKCRPKNETILSCRFADPKVVLTLLTTVGDSPIIHHSKEFRNCEEPDERFEFNFEPGNNSITTTSWISPSKLGIVRALVDQLSFNIGANLTANTTDSFQILGNSSAGTKCSAYYFVDKHKIDKKDKGDVELSKNEKSRVHDLVVVPGTTLKDEVMKIIISRYLGRDTCNTITSSSRRVNRHVTNAKSYVIITESNFTSYTDYHVLFEKSSSKLAKERVSLTLDDIVPAEDPLPSFVQCRTFGQQGVKAFQSDSFEYVFETNLYDYYLSLVGDKP